MGGRGGLAGSSWEIAKTSQPRRRQVVGPVPRPQKDGAGPLPGLAGNLCSSWF